MEEGKEKKNHKKGILYLSTIPPYMNVVQIREIFSEFGNIGKVYLQLSNKDDNNDPFASVIKKKKSRRRLADRYSEGWVEFERKSIAKQVAQYLNGRQVSTKKKSKQYDSIWSIKYLSNFKWEHLHEQLTYEKATKRQQLRADIQLAKKQADIFASNLSKVKTNNTINTEMKDLDFSTPQSQIENEKQKDGLPDDRLSLLKCLFRK